MKIFFEYIKNKFSLENVTCNFHMKNYNAGQQKKISLKKYKKKN